MKTILFLFTLLVPSLSPAADQTVFRMEKENAQGGKPAYAAEIKAVIGADNSVSAYRVEIQNGSQPKKSITVGSESMGDNPIFDRLVRRLSDDPRMPGAKKIIAVKQVSQGIDPCYSGWYLPFSYWLADADGKLTKVFTNKCSGNAPFVEPELKEQRQALDDLRDYILLLADIKMK